MTRKSFILFFLLLAGACFAQKKEMKIIYYDLNWKKVSKYDASYYRKSYLENDTLYVTDYYINGNRQMTGKYADRKGKVQNGFFTYYNDKGIRSSEGNKVNNKSEGKWLLWDEAGESSYIGNYINDKREGDWTSFFKSGKVRGIHTYTNDTLVKVREFSEDERELNENDTFSIVEKMPAFNGDLNTYLANNLRYPKEAREKGIDGKVILEFTVNKQGEIHNIYIVTHAADPSLGEESWRVIRLMPNWIPGFHKGKPVNVRVKLPMRFILN